MPIVIAWCGVRWEEYRPDVVRRNAAWRDVRVIMDIRVVCVPEEYLSARTLILTQAHRDGWCQTDLARSSGRRHARGPHARDPFPTTHHHARWLTGGDAKRVRRGIDIEALKANRAADQLGPPGNRERQGRYTARVGRREGRKQHVDRQRTTRRPDRAQFVRQGDPCPRALLD